jgi:hypothetical protein
MDNLCLAAQIFYNTTACLDQEPEEIFEASLRAHPPNLHAGFLHEDVLWCWRPGTCGLGLGRVRRRMTGIEAIRLD